MSELAKACIEHRDSHLPSIYLDTCLVPQVLDFANDHPHVLPLILLILGLIMLGSWITVHLNGANQTLIE